MGSCWSSGQKEEARMEKLRHTLDGFSTKEEREEFVLHFITLFDEAKGESRDKALATLANVIRLVQNTK